MALWQAKYANRKIPPHPAWAKAIRDLRLHLKLSQAGLGANTGFSAMTVSRWERGAQEPPSQGYIGLGNLSRNANSWYFWEGAGLRSEDVMRVLPTLHFPLRDFEIVIPDSFEEAHG